MTDYNDGQPHIWHGGECPVHPRTEVKIWFRSDLRPNPAAWAGGEDWMHTGRNSDIIAFQVTKPYVEQVDDSQPAVSVPPDISLRIRNLLCKAIDDLENDRGVDLIELERLCILAASQPAIDPAATREAALQAKLTKAAEALVQLERIVGDILGAHLQDSESRDKAIDLIKTTLAELEGL